ncbi:MAG TPA: hypothetical protein VJJ20_03660 [Candidatus Paceibacterota bacterium]
MNQRQSKSFSGFLFAFIGIVSLAFGVLIWAGSTAPEPVDNIAQPN